MRPQGLEFRAKQKHGVGAAALPTVIERLFAQAVAAKCQCARLPVPNSKGKHAHGPLNHALNAPGFKTSQQRLGIGVPTPSDVWTVKVQPIAPCIGHCERSAAIQMVVNLAVEGNHIATRGRLHGLSSRGGQVHDSQAAVTQCDTGIRIEPIAVRIGATVGDGVGHFAQRRPR